MSTSVCILCGSSLEQNSVLRNGRPNNLCSLCKGELSRDRLAVHQFETRVLADSALHGNCIVHHKDPVAMLQRVHEAQLLAGLLA